MGYGICWRCYWLAHVDDEDSPGCGRDYPAECDNYTPFCVYGGRRDYYERNFPWILDEMDE